MEPAHRFGKGRGRGRGKTTKTTQNLVETKVKSGNASNGSAANVQKIRAQHTEAIEKALDGYHSSSEEEDLDEDRILESLMKSYKGTLGKNSYDLKPSPATEYLFESCQSGATTCLICISNVKRHEAIWSCTGCFAIFHLGCIQRWVREGNARHSMLSDELFPNQELPWFCPKCRFEYKQRECPTRYTCYCGKVVDPVFDPWLVPHSCGDTCDRPLQPECGHRCLLLCHPGPCPPCPKTIRVSCYCGRQPKTIRRCGAAEWSCSQRCQKMLKCGKHTCQDNCHPGACAPCTFTSIQFCVCGKFKKELPCTGINWKCEEKCGKILSCGVHSCERVCHAEKCGNCPRTGVRSCPCGKTVTDDLPCTVDVPTCDDTCGKSLGCYGGHKCTRRCHYGPCGPCPLLVEKKCRCGKRTKETPCHREYTCDVKCQKMRDCGKHQCKRKCCGGNCPTCEQICGRTLQCKRHKCQSRCHQGRCYPCILTSRITCHCGASGITVVCGKEKTTKPPRCKKQCTKSSSCHHPTRAPHSCHFGDCPKCKQVCSQVLKCGHTCPADCHDQVLVKKEVKAAGPWELPSQPEYILKCLPCPDCRFPILKHCLGDHEKSHLPCFEARRYCCGRKCGRMLLCGNHRCTLFCHEVLDAIDDKTAGKNCAECTEPCKKMRPEGCTHECPLPCHSQPCPPCKKRIRKRCHCGMVVLHHICSEWTSADDETKLAIESCGSNCPKMLSCGHPCTSLCHAGDCPGPETCHKKMTIRCPCKRRKKEFRCFEVFQAASKVQCDNMCLEIKAKVDAERQEKLRVKKEEEERIQKIELEKFDRKMQKSSKSRRRRRSIDLDEESNKKSIFKQRNFQFGIFGLCIIVLMTYAYTLIINVE